ncbi:MAG: MBL fold metallo-hydrolase, partial [Gemmobacter sp.]|nr:MBL fold metallo-hydrolase [Gemmobacter sp.]
MITPELTRRHAFLAGLAALPALGAAARPARAAVGPLGPTLPGFQRFQLGSFEVVPLLAGARTSDRPQETFGLNASPEEFAALAERNFIPADRTRNSFTPVLVNTGAELVLFDTGLAPDGVTAALAAAGYSPGQVDLVVLTHMHGDHIGGLMGEGLTFPNARYLAGAVEYDHWAKAGNEGFDGKVRPLAGKMTMVKGGDSALPGLTAIDAPGHTPGHMAWRL